MVAGAVVVSDADGEGGGSVQASTSPGPLQLLSPKLPDSTSLGLSLPMLSLDPSTVTLSLSGWPSSRQGAWVVAGAVGVSDVDGEGGGSVQGSTSPGPLQLLSPLLLDSTSSGLSPPLLFPLSSLGSVPEEVLLLCRRDFNCLARGLEFTSGP